MPVWFAKSKTGGTSGSLDFHNGSRLSDGDGGLIFDLANLELHSYVLDADSGETADGEAVISPVVNAGLKRWKRVSVVSLFMRKPVVTVTALSLSVTGLYQGSCLDCYNAADQTLTIDTLSSDDDGAEFYITKMGAGNVIINAPSGVTFDGADNQITIRSIGYECKLRYNHTRAMLVITYSGNITGAVV